MTKRISALSRSYKFYETDIWGRITRKPRLSKIKNNLISVLQQRYNSDKTQMANKFTYRIDITKNTNKKKVESIYKRNLITRQTLRKFYGEITLKQFKKIYKEAQKHKTNILETFLSLVEQRLDIFLYRIGFASTIFEARQLINHKHILINNKVINKKNFILKKNDIITIKDNQKLRIKNNIKINLEKKLILMYAPAYAEVNYNTLTAIFLRKPRLKEIWYPMNLDMSNIIRSFHY